MKQLGILDSAFINLEQTNTPQHIGGLGIYDPSTAPGGLVRFKQVIASFERRLNKQPLFRTRLLEVPGGIDRPYWVKDANFDVEFHLRHIALPAPGDWRQLCIQVARLHSRPIDMSRPLWETYIIEGLDNVPHLPAGSFAVYTKMHHALVDGAGGSSFMELLHDLVAEPAHELEGTEFEPRLVDSEPPVSELLTKASINGLKNTAGLLRGSISTARDMGKYLLQIARKEIPSPDVSAPKTILNKPVGPHRVFDAAEFPLSGFKSIKNVAGVTLNDVALGVIGGALQRYLEAKGEAPQGSLVAGLPLNMRTRRETTEDNNQVGSVFSSLHTNISNPLDRLQAVHHSTMEAKEYGEHSPMVDALKIAGAFSPFLMKAASSLWSRNKLSRHMPLTISTVISNVAGPSFPLYCAGAKMIDYYGLGLLTPGVGIFHLVFSYSGKLTLSVLADRDIMPDPQFYHDCLHASYDELYLAAEALTEKPKADSKVLPVSRKKAKAKAKPKSKPKANANANANANAKKVSVKPKAKVKPKFKAKPKIRQKAKS
jgi:diacylglycerol O-acyltransferase